MNKESDIVDFSKKRQEKEIGIEVNKFRKNLPDLLAERGISVDQLNRAVLSEGNYTKDKEERDSQAVKDFLKTDLFDYITKMK